MVLAAVLSRRLQRVNLVDLQRGPGGWPLREGIGMPPPWDPVKGQPRRELAVT